MVSVPGSVHREELVRFIVATTPRLPRRRRRTPKSGGQETDVPDDSHVAAPEIPRSSRWSTVSGSANAEMDYRRWIMQNPETAYSFVCLCRPPFVLQDDEPERQWDGREFDDSDRDASDEEDDEEDNEDDGEVEIEYTEDEYGCTAGKHCLCDKPAADHPEHIWKLSAAGKRKLFAQRIHYQLRCPLYFATKGYKFHVEYGMLEMLQNLILDYAEADGNYREQWAVCETLAFFLGTTVSRSLQLYVPFSLSSHQPVNNLGYACNYTVAYPKATPSTRPTS